MNAWISSDYSLIISFSIRWHHIIFKKLPGSIQKFFPNKIVSNSNAETGNFMFFNVLSTITKIHIRSISWKSENRTLFGIHAMEEEDWIPLMLTRIFHEIKSKKIWKKFNNILWDFWSYLALFQLSRLCTPQEILIHSMAYDLLI